jgi:predicted small secreted protein
LKSARYKNTKSKVYQKGITAIKEKFRLNFDAILIQERYW